MPLLRVQVVGIWFYDDEECDRISALLQRIATTFAAPSAAELGGGGKQVGGRRRRGSWLPGGAE